MSLPKGDGGRLSVVMANEILASPSSQPLIQQDEETSDCPLLTPSPPPNEPPKDTGGGGSVVVIDEPPTPMMDRPSLGNINCEDGLAFLNIVNSSCKPMHDEPSSRDPMVETSSNSGSSSDTNEPVCTQLLTQLNTAYTHLAPDAQALFCNQDNGGIQPLTGIQLMVPKPPKNYGFMSWNWPIIRKTCFWSLMSLFAGCIALAIGIIATMPQRCDPPVEWWQGSLFYEIFPASFQDAYKDDGIGDFRGISSRLDYLENLGVKSIRLNSVFPAKEYPKRYMDVLSLTEVDPSLGTLQDFSDMATAIHKKNMTLVLDLPLYPFIKNFNEGNTNNTSNNRLKREDSSLPDLPSHHETRDALLSAPAQAIQPNIHIVANPLENNVVTKIIRFWREHGVDGFYLKGLEYYTNESSFIAALRYWKAILGPNRILMCSEKALENAPEDAKNAILNRMDLVDVTLGVANGTKDIKDRVSGVLKGLLFQKAGYPWVHWSTGSVDRPRLASTLGVANASVAIAMLGMTLPGTPSIFYGDELGLLNSDSKDFSHLHQLVPMHWENQNGGDQGFSKPGVAPWIPASSKPATSSPTALVSKMAKLRSETMPIYVKAVVKNTESTANGDVRYTTDEMIIIERWYPRRNTYVFVSNLGVHTQTKDLSTIYYSGHVVVGPEYKLNRDIYFKEFTIPPGEAFIIKLDK